MELSLTSSKVGLSIVPRQEKTGVSLSRKVQGVLCLYHGSLERDSWERGCFAVQSRDLLSESIGRINQESM